VLTLSVNFYYVCIRFMLPKMIFVYILHRTVIAFLKGT